MAQQKEVGAGTMAKMLECGRRGCRALAGDPRLNALRVSVPERLQVYPTTDAIDIDRRQEGGNSWLPAVSITANVKGAVPRGSGSLSLRALSLLFCA